MRYEIPFAWHTRSAKTKGIIPCDWRRDADVLVVEANSDDQAYAMVLSRITALSKTDKRRIMGKSYVRQWRAADVHLNNGPVPADALPKYKVGDRVVLHRPHADHRIGVIDEVLGDYHYGIKLDDYPNIADFHVREFAPGGN